MEAIILVGHGSPRKQANRMDSVCSILHARMHGNCAKPCVRSAYLEFEKPGIEEAIDSAVSDGAASIVIHPYFLNAGVHVTKDIPEAIASAQQRHPEVPMIYTEPLGLSEEIVNVVEDRIRAAKGIKPEGIEPRSFEIIEREIDLKGFKELDRPVVTRVVHTTADFEFATTMRLHSDAVAMGIKAIRDGRDIITDVEMVRAGVRARDLKRFGGQVVCRIGDAEPSEGQTRAEAGIGMAMREGNVGIIAIGNAPTALIKCVEMMKRIDEPRPLIVGVPVGFVRAVESKDLLAAQDFPYITNVGRKGGSTVAAAIVNAIIKLAVERP